MAGQQTKQRGETSLKGLSKEELKSNLQVVFDKYDDLPGEENQKIKLSRKLKFPVDMYASKDSVARVRVPLTLLVSVGFKTADIDKLADALNSASLERWVSVPRQGEDDKPGVTNQLVSYRTFRTIGRPIKVVLPDPYPVQINRRTEDAPEGQQTGAVTLQYKHLTLRIPRVVPLVGVGLFLAQINTKIQNEDLKYKKFYGESGNVEYFVPGMPGADTVAEAKALMAVTTEISP